MEIEINGEVYVRFYTQRNKPGRAIGTLMTTAMMLGGFVAPMHTKTTSRMRSEFGYTDNELLEQYFLILKKECQLPSNSRKFVEREFHRRFMLKTEFEQRMKEQREREEKEAIGRKDEE